MTAALLYVKDAAQVVTVAGASGKPKTGAGMNDIGVIACGSVVVDGDTGLIVFVGSVPEAESFVRDRIQASPAVEVHTVDAAGKIVLPGLIDPHTHLVFAGTREHELEMRLQGATYMEILQQGGGILYSTAQTRKATEEQLAEQSEKRLDRFLLHGVTTVEAKSGYGLTTDDELKQLRVARRLHESHPVDIVSTFMGAHAVPAEYKTDPDEYVRIVIEEMLPKVAEEGLADFCDVFCEQGVFTVEQSERILEAGKRHGLIPKIHADEIVSFGGAELAAKVGAISADHLLKASDEGIRRMAEEGVIAVLLPGTALYLREEPARAREMIKASVAVALSTDRNPGSCPTESLPLIQNLGCLMMRMTPAEVITASTINAAHAIGRAAEIGSIEVGKKADLVLFDAPNYAYLQYNFGVNLVDTVIKNGRIVVQGGIRCDGE
ncbi:imidazolonepropionase [Paenibacillus montanisoli]|uniref:Imidazolonepropionase n=1 Tax=Paenibacillus montanisoli TaxID=2081970 RepID=A0A328TWN4_9BACL|nr:imidazolonepropionase [Paenibacillus montanisoli]RAP74790.1 imidazolonepropionase [Paenibacillus montanisoli]